MADKYWHTSLVPDQSVASTVNFRHITENGDHYQVDYVTKEPQTVAPGAEASLPSRLFAGAKIVRLLDRYQAEDHIPSFDKAVDFGWFYFLTKPIFYCLDWLNSLLGNFGLAILVFTVFVKALFFPLANYSYRSMSKMKLLAPKMQALRERFKDEPQRMQQEMMAMYRTEKVNPASGCLAGSRICQRSIRPTSSTCSGCCRSIRRRYHRGCIWAPGRSSWAARCGCR